MSEVNFPSKMPQNLAAKRNRGETPTPQNTKVFVQTTYAILACERDALVMYVDTGTGHNGQTTANRDGPVIITTSR